MDRNVKLKKNKNQKVANQDHSSHKMSITLIQTV